MAEVDFKDAIAAPSSHFRDPASVLNSGFDEDQKRQLLTQWAYELRQLSVAAEENMPGEGDGATVSTLSKVNDALTRLGGDSDPHGAKT